MSSGESFGRESESRTDADAAPKRHVIELDDYEVANLHEGLLFLRACGGDTGDWMGQILMKLPEVERKPNVPLQNQKRELAVRVGWRALWPV